MALNDKTAAQRLPVGAVYAGGLLLVFLGERILSTYEGARYALTGLGLVAMAATTAVRFAGLGAHGDAERKRAERTLAFLSLGGLVAIAIYFATTEGGRTALGIAAMSPDKRARVDAVLEVTWIGGLLLSLLPLLLGELALAPMRRAARIEARRVRFAIRAGVTLGLAALYCALFTFAAGELDWKLDYSYFRTSKPSESTIAIAASATEPIEVTAFFPELNDVGAEVAGYLRDVARGGPNVKLSFHDRLLEPGLAKEKKVTSDGVIVLTRGPSREVVTLGSEMKSAGTKLKTLDQDFQKSLLKVLREARTAYLTVGHGELNEAGEGKAEGRTGKIVKSLLESQNYNVKDLGVVQGLAAEVPSDAGLVVVLGPTRAFSAEEVAALGRFADKGGHLLLALDPDGGADDGPLAAIVGLTWDRTTLANDRVFVTRRHDPSDKAFIGTNRYSSHASVSTLSRYSSSLAVLFDRAGSLDKAPGAPEKIDFAVKTMPDTFADTNANYTFDANEKRTSYNVAAAVTKPGNGEGKKDAKGNDPEMRAFVVADADCFDDVILSGSESNKVFLYDLTRWLGGEESFAGAISSNEDVRIEHTRQKDVLWFYATIFGAPGLVLAVGVWRARRRKKATPAPKSKPPSSTKSAPKKTPKPEPESREEAP